MILGEENEIQQDANTQESSEPASPAPEPQEANTTPAPDQGSEGQTNQSKPFHEDPRVQEYLERQIAKRTETYEQRLAEQQRQFQDFQQRFHQSQQPPKAAHPLIEQMRQIDPRYAEYLEGLEKKASGVEELREKLQGFEQTNTRQTYESTLSKLHEQYKVPEDMRTRIQREVEYEAMRNPRLGLRELPDLYKSKFEDYSKWIDGIKRAERASYVQTKQQDAKAPTTQPKGKVPSRNDRGQFVPGDREELMASVVKSALSRSKAASDI